MYFSLRRFPRLLLPAFLAAASLFVPSLSAADPPAPPPAQPPANAHAAPPEVKLSLLAHKILADGLRLNALAGDGLQPWHIKIDYQARSDFNPKPIHGSVEQWSADAYRWKRICTSKDDAYDCSIWSTSKTSRFQTRYRIGDYAQRLLVLRVARPVLDPLYQAANIKPNYQMQIQKVTTAGVNLFCISVVDPARYAPKTDPNFLFPTYCFDAQLHLHLVVAGDTTVQFDDLQPFQNRMVARKVQVIQNGNLMAQMNVSVLESWTPAPDELEPPKNAELLPYAMEPGQPHPEPVYQVGASIPILDGGFPFRGIVPVPVIIRKDGSVKVEGHVGLIYEPPAVTDAVSNAVSKWKYKPYLVDGQPVEVAYTVIYLVDGKPFVPIYDMPRTPPGDFSSAYDFHRDPAQDLILAESEAQAQHKRILLEVGGDWCYWCHQLDNFFKSNSSVQKFRDDNFILVKVNMSAENANSAFLSHYPSIPGYPWIFVLDAEGKFLKSEDTDLLQSGHAYTSRNITAFLTAWKPGGPGDVAAK